MRRILARVLAVLMFMVIAGGLLPGIASAQSTQNFTITDFTADYYIGRTEQKVPTMEVNELILANFPGTSQNHGILRAIPDSYKGQPLDIQVKSITDGQGKPYQFTTSKDSGNLVLKIGDPDTYVRGTTVYNIVYTLKNQMSFWANHDELYWDVNGDQWQQSFGAVTARIHIPASIASELQDQQLCYTGSYGSNTQNCTIARSHQNEDVVVTTQAKNLGAGETLTYVLAFNSGTFSVDKAAQRAKIMRIALFALLLIGIPLIFLFFVISKWRKYGRDSAGRGTIVPEYTPPKKLAVLTSDVLLQEKLRTQAITATIIELAVQKFIAIFEVTEKKFLSKATQYELELQRKPGKVTSEQAAVISMLFPSQTVGTRVKLADRKNSFYKEVAKLSKSVPKALYETGYFRNDPVKARNKYYIFGTLLLIGGIITSFFLIGVYWPLTGLTGGVALAGLIALLAANTMPARSALGVEMRDYLRGLEMYMKLAEAERIKYLQSPKGVKQWGDPNDPQTKIKLFEKLLPYAMIFGIEKDWAKEFKDIYNEPPDWYHGNWTAFNTVFLVSSLNSFNATSVASFSPPSSSGSSGTGGGGFSGGGGGGGGGGGW